MIKTINGVYEHLIRFFAPTYYTRPMFKYLKKQNNNKQLKGFEIGTKRGYNALAILTYLKIKKLYLIDSFKPYYENNRYYPNKNVEKEAYRNLVGHIDSIKFIKKDSENAIKDIPDNLDFGYIDGNHTYDSVKQDIALYYPKIREGGILGGHDYSGSYIDGVIKAVNEFVEENKLQLHGKNDDWWVVKPVGD